MNTELSSWTRPQAKREKRENSLSSDKNQGNLTYCVHKAVRGSPQKQCLPGKKKGDRENLSPVCGGGQATGFELPLMESWGQLNTLAYR